MSYINDYRLVEKSSLIEFRQEINKLLGEGWELYGATQVVITDYINQWNVKEFQTTYYQAMVLLKKATP